MFFSLLPVPFVKGDSCPEICAQRTDEGEGFLWCKVQANEGAYVRDVSFVFLLSYISLRDLGYKTRISLTHSLWIFVPKGARVRGRLCNV
jgi:hypothetical protein